MNDYKSKFFQLALAKGNLRFGQFTLKSGRISPYFFNAGGFDDGESLAILADCYAAAICDSGLSFDMLFGPAYKGIPLAAATAVALFRQQRNYPYAYNRKEAKDHGEGGILVGAPLTGRVLIVDDVISAGTSVRESIDLIRAAGAEPAGVAIALDRQELGQDCDQERGQAQRSAAQEVEAEFGIPCIAIASLDDLLRYLQSQQIDGIDLQALHNYRECFGV
jgi:orotate phosphoribosyltransferase